MSVCAKFSAKKQRRFMEIQKVVNLLWSMSFYFPLSVAKGFAGIIAASDGP